ncbi:MAG: serine hydrolase domain-containing protein [Planctomycetota bacterium]
MTKYAMNSGDLSMIAFRSLLVCLFWAAAALGQDSPFPTAKPESVGLDPAALEKLSQVIQGFVDEDEIIGGELVIIKDRRTVFQQGYGALDSETKAPWRNDTICNLRSMTKPMTGTLAQMWIDEGKLSLSDKASKYLESFGEGQAAAITIDHLMTHRSGLPLTAIQSDSLQSYESLRQVADQAAGAKLDFEPGTRFGYSDAGTDSLGAIVEVVGGAPLREQLRDRLFAPLHLRDTDTHFAEDDPRQERRSSIHIGLEGSWLPYWQPGDEPFYPFAMGSQSALGTARDYARFLTLWMDGGQVGEERLLSDEAVERGFEPVSDMPYPTWLAGLDVYYGRMWQLWLDEDGKRVAFGHSGSDGTYAIAFPERDLIVLYFTQSRGQQTIPTFEKALEAAVLHPDPEALARVLSKIPPSELAPYLGVYRAEGSDSYRAIILNDGKLSMEIPGQQILELEQSAEADHWQLSRRADQKVHFVRDEDGQVNRIEAAGPVANEVLFRLVPREGTPTADALIPQMLAKHGGDRFASLGTLRLEGEIDIQAQKRKGRMVDLSAGIERRRLEVEFEGAGKQIVAFDGETVWNIAPGIGKPIALKGAQAEQVRLDSLSTTLSDWRLHYREVHVLFQIEFEGQDCWAVRAVPFEAPASTKLVSVETLRLVGELRINLLPGVGALGATVVYSDWRDVSGVQIPFHTSSKSIHPMIGTIVSTYEKAEVGVEIPEGAFEMPEGKQ